MLPGRVLEALRGFTLFSTLSEQESLENCNGMNNLYLVYTRFWCHTRYNQFPNVSLYLFRLFAGCNIVVQR